jgi:membrane carboxypeptidase/penicillin-binding protein PbpC
VNAALALRQPGSALKPFTYAASFEQGLSPATPVADVRTVFRTYEGNPYLPLNYDNQFHGLVSFREALASSYNVAAVRVLDRIGIQALPDMVQRLGIDTLNQPERQGLALTLGGAEVCLLDLTGAYASLAAAGQRRTPYLIERITDAQGNPLYARGAPPPEQAVDPRVAYLVTHVLSDNGARAAAFGYASALELPFPTAVKTGTTTEWRDNWTVGYSTEWTVGVWVGNADGSPMERVTGVTGAAPIWNSLMSIAHGAHPEPFPVPQGLVRQEVCALSGLLPDMACPHRRQEWFLQENVPQSRCNLHSLATVDAQTGQPASADTPP